MTLLPFGRFQDIPNHVSVHDLVLILAVMGAALAGTRFTIWRQGTSGNLLGACLLILISGALATTGEHPIRLRSPTVVHLALVLGLCFGLAFPCCAPPSRLRSLRLAAGAVVLLHGLLDGHIVREAESVSLVVLLAAHKFLDGADTRMLGGSGRFQAATRLAVVAATPVGFFFIPESAVDPTLHASLFAAVIGLNLGNATHLVRHAMHLYRERAVPG